MFLKTAKVAEKLLKITAMVYKTSGAGNWHFYKLLARVEDHIN